MLEAIQTAIEELDADRLPSLSATRAKLIEAVSQAHSASTDNVVGNVTAKRVMAGEKAEMIAFVAGLDENALMQIEPLPYRHVLPDRDGEERWRALKTRWNMDSVNNYWYPLSGDDRPDLLAFDSGCFGRDVHVDVLRNIVRALGAHRVCEFREFDLTAVIDVDLLEPVYTGEEGYWSDASTDWILYASHENSLAVGGPLLAEIKRVWPDWQDYIWKYPW
jgi:hypothetical protein